MKPVWHIYYGTRGTAGSYIDALLKASEKAGLKAKAFVSGRYTYQTTDCVRCFFPITDRSEKRNKFIMLLRGFELILAYFYIAVISIFIRPTITIHLIDDLKITYYLFLFFKKINLQVYITCHDIQSQYVGMTQIRKNMMSNADKLIVHNTNAKVTLINNIGEEADKRINIYPFPFSSYDEIVNCSKIPTIKENLLSLTPQKSFYLFLGVIRNSKGIETLLKAWQISDAKKNSNLVIAGKWTDPSYETRQMADSDSTCIVIDSYISDEEYVSLIEMSKFVVLPYLNYIHSAVLYSCGYHGGAVINSDIKLFEESMPAYPLVFSSGNKHELAMLLNKTLRMDDAEVDYYRKLTKDAIQKEQHELVDKIKLVYN